jgi:ribose-phosphate pyrophosphokinase
MKELNLVYPEKSDIKYKISKFPDGQQNIVLDTRQVPIRSRYSLDSNSPEFVLPITIKSRLNNFQDLELIICATQSLRNLGVKEIHLYTPYFLGSRSDRQFEEGGNNYLKQVICPIINSLNFKSVTVLDPHSDVLEACLNDFRKEDNSKLIKWSITQMYGTAESKILISPDSGALKKIYKLTEQIGYKREVICCSKSRDTNGKLSKIQVPLEQRIIQDKDLVIIDDIGDGCRTFINIAKEIRTKFNNKLYLVITHGIFSQGLLELSKYFKNIYCTNSVKDIDCESYSNYTVKKDFIKQLNVF